MNDSDREAIATLLSTREADLLGAWQRLLKDEGALRAGRLKEAELASQCSGFLRVLRQGFDAGGGDADAPAFAPAREWLAELSRGRALQGYSPRETAVFVLSLKQPLFELLGAHAQLAPAARLQLAWSLGQFLDKLGILTMESYQRTREEVIVRQEREIAELSTPVVKLWDGILALPLIGTLDSQRTQVVMQNLLESIVAQSATIAIIDITGVPTVDTLTAQHLLKTVQAARLMGADCIISGIRPQIAQTMVHLGVELSVVSKATLADAFAVALERRGRCVTRVVAAPRATEPAGAAA